jgi:hypothetical protein
MASPNVPTKAAFGPASGADSEATWAAHVQAAKARGRSTKGDTSVASAASWEAHVRAVKARKLATT